MKNISILNIKATTIVVALVFFGCKDHYIRVGDEVLPSTFPQGVATDIQLIYTEAAKPMSLQDSSYTKRVAVLRSPLNLDFDNQPFPFKEFPDGLEVDFFDENNQKSTVTADYGIIYSKTNLIDLRGNVTITMHDGKILETKQLYWDRLNQWIFTEEDFIFTNPEDGTIMEGRGLDFNRELTYLGARQTFGLMTIKEENK